MTLHVQAMAIFGAKTAKKSQYRAIESRQLAFLRKCARFSDKGLRGYFVAMQLPVWLCSCPESPVCYLMS